jgi:hypothetical protein
VIANNKYFYCIPEKVMESMPDIESLAAMEVPHFNPSYLKELITLIALHQRKDEGEAKLKAKYLNRLIPHYQSYLRFLIDLGVIRRSGKYVPGEVSHSYAFISDYLSRFKYFPVNDMYLVRRIQKNNLKRHNTRKYPGQAGFIRKMTINPEAFEEVKKFPTIEKYNSGLASVLKIQQGDIFYSVDKTSGRFHSNLTNLPESLRRFIRINGKQLANIDIKNSQPYLSTILLTDPGKASPFAKSKELSMLLHSLKRIDSMNVTMFDYLVFKGKIYEFLMEKGFAQDRKEAKRQLFVIMFGPGSYWSKQHEIFEKWFPEVYERFTIIKGHARGSKFESYKRLAILLQSIEAHLVLDTILPNIYKEHPGIIAVTIHDSVLTSIMTNDVKLVMLIMEKELTGYVGSLPTLKVENLAKTHTNMNNSEYYKEKEEGDRIRKRQYHYGSTNLVMN